MSVPFFDITYIVDDSTTARFIHSEIIKQLGVSEKIINSNSSIDALKSLIIDLIDEKRVLLLLDIEMPILDGLNFLDIISELRLKKSQLCVFIVSSRIGDNIARETLYHRLVQKILCKPIRKNEIEQELELFYQGKDYLTQKMF